MQAQIIMPLKASPETGLELRIVSSKVFKECLDIMSFGKGHREKNLAEHISQILGYIDRQPQWIDYRGDLRLMALLHDLGKKRVKRDERGNVINKGHSAYSAEIANSFIDDPRLLYLISIHDKYFGFYKSHQRGKFREDKFLNVFGQADLETLRRFNYADSNNREKQSVMWFEDMALDRGLIPDLLYLKEPQILRD